jgi:hypothetical protein
MSKIPLTVFAVTMISGAFIGAAIAADLGMSINIGEPGFYGQLDIGDFPQPQVIYSKPVLIERAPGYGSRRPIYLHVPPGHEKHWSKYCGQYDACGQPAYFVRDGWYPTIASATMDLGGKITRTRTGMNIATSITATGTTETIGNGNGSNAHEWAKDRSDSSIGSRRTGAGLRRLQLHQRDPPSRRRLATFVDQ